MPSNRIRLSPQTLEAVTELAQKCGLDDIDSVIKILIRKYGDDLVQLLAPFNPNRDSVTVTDSIQTIQAQIIPSTQSTPATDGKTKFSQFLDSED